MKNYPHENKGKPIYSGGIHWYFNKTTSKHILVLLPGNIFLHKSDYTTELHERFYSSGQ